MFFGVGGFVSSSMFVCYFVCYMFVCFVFLVYCYCVVLCDCVQGVVKILTVAMVKKDDVLYVTTQRCITSLPSPLTTLPTYLPIYLFIFTVQPIHWLMIHLTSCVLFNEYSLLFLIGFFMSRFHYSIIFDYAHKQTLQNYKLNYASPFHTLLKYVSLSSFPHWSVSSNFDFNDFYGGNGSGKFVSSLYPVNG